MGWGYLLEMGDKTMLPEVGNIVNTFEYGAGRQAPDSERDKRQRRLFGF
jgi:hypothetical protein